MMTLFSDPLFLATSSDRLSDVVPIVAIIFGVGFLIVKTITKAIVDVNLRKNERNAQAFGFSKSAMGRLLRDIDALPQDVLSQLGQPQGGFPQVAAGAPSQNGTKQARRGRVMIPAALALVLGAGIYLPAPLVAWFQHVARLLG
jgi:hypothetical protein